MRSGLLAYYFKLIREICRYLLKCFSSTRRKKHRNEQKVLTLLLGFSKVLNTLIACRKASRSFWAFFFSIQGIDQERNLVRLGVPFSVSSRNSEAEGRSPQLKASLGYTCVPGQLWVQSDILLLIAAMTMAASSSSSNSPNKQTKTKNGKLFHKYSLLT